jgi:hypothetical protein
MLTQQKTSPSFRILLFCPHHTEVNQSAYRYKQNTLTHTNSHTHTHSLTHTHSHTHKHTHTPHTLSHTLTHTHHTHTHKLTHTLTHTHNEMHLKSFCVFYYYICTATFNFTSMFEFSCIITLYYIKNQQATLAVLFISHCKITLRPRSVGNRPWTSVLDIYHPDP